MPEQVDLGFALKLPPKDAIDYLSQRGRELPTGLRWQDVWQQAHARAFTVAGVMKADVLGDIHASLVKARQEGIGFADWEKSIVPTLEKKGWFAKTGPRLITDKTTGEVLGKKLTPARMKLIFDQNMQTAYMAGRYRQMKANAEFRPWWQYTAVMDGKTRPAHRALHGKTFRHDDPFWDAFYPPNGFRCRCNVRAFGDSDIEARGIPASNSQGRLDSVQKPIDKAGSATAAVARYRPVDGPPVTVDVGFNYNPGAWAWHSDRGIRKAVIERVPAEKVIPILRDIATQHARIADYQSWVRLTLANAEALGTKAVFGTAKVIGYMAVADELFLTDRGHKIADGAITLEDRMIAGRKADRHEAKGDALTREEWLMLPTLLARPAAVLYQVDRGTLLYVMDALDASGRRIKIAVEAGRLVKTGESVDSVRTAFKIKPEDLTGNVKNGNMVLVRGKL